MKILSQVLLLVRTIIMFGDMEAYYDMPIGNSGYIYTTDQCPFCRSSSQVMSRIIGPATKFLV